MANTVPRQWPHLKPQGFLIGVLTIVGILFLTEHFQWFGDRVPKGWAPLAALATVALALLILVAWYAASRFSSSPISFSLRWLLLLVTVVAITFGWFAVRLQQAARQRAAIEAMEKLGGSQLYDWQMGVANARPPAPAWLHQLLGVDFFSNPYGIQPAGDAFTEEALTCSDDDLVHLQQLDKLEFLALNDAPISDEGLAHIAVLKHLTSLGLNGTRITDDGLRYLSGCKDLKSLLMGNTRITDAGLTHLEPLQQLEHLYLGQTDITGKGLQYLTRFQNLKSLHLWRTNLSDSDIDRFKQALPNCKVVK